MKFFMTHPVAQRRGLYLWKFYEAGKRWPFYKGSVWAADFASAYKHFEEFVASAKAHARSL